MQPRKSHPPPLESTTATTLSRSYLLFQSMPFNPPAATSSLCQFHSQATVRAFVVTLLCYSYMDLPTIDNNGKSSGYSLDERPNEESGTTADNWFTVNSGTRRNMGDHYVAIVLATTQSYFLSTIADQDPPPAVWPKRVSLSLISLSAIRAAAVTFNSWIDRSYHLGGQFFGSFESGNWVQEDQQGEERDDYMGNVNNGTGPLYKK